MADDVRLAMVEAGWVEKEGYSGIYVRGPELVRTEQLEWVAEPDDVVRQIEDAVKQAK
ncbi:MAG: hypothetical protein ACHQ4J_00930 [Candidatus Binatia bacterium]